MSEIIGYTMRLLRHQPWLTELENELVALFSDCENMAQMKLLCGLLERFHYSTSSEFTEGLNAIAQYLFSDNLLEPSQSQMYGLEHSREADSAHEIVYRFKSIVAKKYGQGLNLTATLNQAPKFSVDERPNIILVDEFIGSGQSANTAVSQLLAKVKRQGFSPDRIYLCYVVGMKLAVDRIRGSYGINVYCHKVLSKGISDYYQGAHKVAALQNMRKLERKLADPCPYTQATMPSLGYNAAETLYAREDGNPPNNNFPVLWWPAAKRGNSGFIDRKTLLVRAR